MQNKKILFIQAHCDDTDYYCGGTIYYLVQQGFTVYYLICTDGKYGNAGAKSLAGAELIKQRQTEQLQANKILGVKKTYFLKLKDLKYKNKNNLLKNIIYYICTIKPSVIFTFDFKNYQQYHPDHRLIGEVTMDAVLSSKLLLYKLPRKNLKHWQVNEIFFYCPEKANYFVEVTNFMDKKLRALSCHKTQFGNVTKKKLKNLLITETTDTIPAANIYLFQSQSSIMNNINTETNILNNIYEPYYRLTLKKEILP